MQGFRPGCEDRCACAFEAQCALEVGNTGFAPGAKTSNIFTNTGAMIRRGDATATLDIRFCRARGFGA